MLGANISSFRKKLGLTQEQLAQKLDVTNQAVSKWETDQSCPDTMLLPRIADVFGIAIDQLFGREPVTPEEKKVEKLPWADDEAFHVVLYHGHTLIGAQPAHADVIFEYEGPAKDIYCALNLQCGDVSGNVSAEGNVECGDVSGNVMAGAYVECAGVSGNVTSLAHVECGDVGGNGTGEGSVDTGDGGFNLGGLFGFGKK